MGQKKETFEEKERILRELLDDVLKIKENYQTESGFNIFKTLGIENKEVIICRFLGELLDPHGSHGLDVLFLNSFMEEVLKLDSVPDLQSIKGSTVKLEEQIDSERRVDIVIHCRNNITDEDLVFPIEVKIWADDQPSQLYDYYHYYFGDDDPRKKIYYLTPTGWKPSDKSINGADGRNHLNDENIGILSFRKDIKNWLQVINIEPKNEFLEGIIKQFIEVIDEMSEDYDFEVVLGLKDEKDKKTDIDYVERQKAAFDLMAKSDFLMKRIRQEHIKKYLELSGSYKCEFCDSDKQAKKFDPHALVVIKKNDKDIAYICVDTNLYLCCKDVKPEREKDFEGKKGYFWQYIGPEKDGKKFDVGKPFDMKNYPEKLKEGDKIRVMELLEQIDDAE